MSERREFFQSTIGKLLHEVARRTEQRVAPKRWFRPPSAADEVAFVAACTRCGDCIDVCPVHAILKMPANGGGLAAGTPYIDPTTRACIACEDMPCAAACETGALTKIPWDQVHMGILELDPQRCITFQGAACGV
ncbi:MAG TPA: 4Fe-4S dicluster domain-containing protein, partial [Gemmatimonadales bacterium]|nr:4Fe-4S dicluster domain-containing protein [Gemmatimonadales bacterium]